MQRSAGLVYFEEFFLLGAWYLDELLEFFDWG